MIDFGDIPMNAPVTDAPNIHGVGKISDFQPITRFTTKTVGLQDGHFVSMEGNRKPYTISRKMALRLILNDHNHLKSHLFLRFRF